MHEPDLSPAGFGRPMSDIVRRSWDRSLRRGLDASETLLFNEISSALQRRVRDRNHGFLQAAAPEMSSLCRSFGNTGWIVACIDDTGMVIDAQGAPATQASRLNLAFRTGVAMGEDAVGTNGPGCALVERKPVIVSGNDHYLQEAKVFTCVAVPVLDPRGRLLGALDASCEHGGDPMAVIDSLALAGRAVENRLVYELENATFIRFHHRSDMVGTPLEGILAFSEDGCLLGLNQTARHIFSINEQHETQMPFESLFDIAFHRAVDRLRAARHTPVCLESVRGARLHARIGCSPDFDRDTLQRTRIVAGVQLPKKPSVIAQDEQLGRTLDKAARAFAHDIPILINGETGTGKEVVARLLHDNGPRAQGPFVAINCSSIPATLIESELFGYTDGAFTGGRRGGAAGKLEQASGGTLFLDEIGDMPHDLQVRLLRVLQERNLTRIGGQELIDIDISLVCATHRNLAQQVAAGTFREDLFYRINGLRIQLPPLRERADIKALIEQVLTEACAGRPLPRVADAAMHALLRYSWPGNIRQLQHVLRLAAVLAEDDGCIDIEHLPQEILATHGCSPEENDTAGGRALPQLRQSEAELIRASMLTMNGNVSAAARSIGVSRQTLYRKLKEYGMQELAGDKRSGMRL